MATNPRRTVTVILIFFLLANETHVLPFPRPARDATRKKLDAAMKSLVRPGQHLRLSASKFEFHFRFSRGANAECEPRTTRGRKVQETEVQAPQGSIPYSVGARRNAQIGVIINEIVLIEVHAPLGNFTLLVLDETRTYRRSS